MDTLRCRPQTYYCHINCSIEIVFQGLLAEIVSCELVMAEEAVVHGVRRQAVWRKQQNDRIKFDYISREET